MPDVRAAVFDTASVSVIAAGQVASFAFAESGLRVISLGVSTLTGVIFAYNAVRREMRRERKARIELDRAEREAEADAKRISDERDFLDACRKHFDGIPPSEWPKPKGPQQPLLFDTNQF